MSLPDYIVIPRFIPKGGPVPPQRRGASDDEVTEIRRLHDRGHSPARITEQFQHRYSLKHICDIVRKRGRFADAK